MTCNTNLSKRCSTGPLIYKLCSHLIKQQDEVVDSTYRFVLRALSTAPLPHDLDEFVIAEKIKKKMVKQGHQKEALAFADLYRKLQNSKVLQNRSSVLCLLYSLYGTNKQYDRYAQFASELAQIAAAVPEISLHAKDVIMSKPVQAKNRVASVLKSENHTENQRKNFQAEMDNLADGKSRVAHVAAMFSKKAEMEKKQLVTWSYVKHEKSARANNACVNENESKNNIIFDKDILCDILYVVQGISGSNISWKQERKNFTVSIKDSIGNSTRKLILRFAEMGWMFTKINQFCKEKSTEKTLGLIGQSFVAALQEEVIEYYRILATLQAQLQNQVEVKGSRLNLPLTIHRLSVWFMDPFRRLQVLTSVVEASINKKGGALTSVLFSYLQHGDKSVHEPIKHLLMTTIQPLYRMLSNWIFCGELEDSYGEFFVIGNITYPESNMWQEKYSLNKAMIPSFLSMEQAKKILSTGKAINFLRQVCHDHSFVKDNELMKKKHAKNVESLFMQENDSEFHLIVEKNYQKTSQLVLSVLHNEYKLMAHFQAMRNYLLLGQGDFIRHIMDLLQPELEKSPNMLYEHILLGIVESAIRATNAQYHEQEILQRLDVKLQESSVKDTGWDVFTLNYKIDGPIATVFTTTCMASYLRLFKSLWRAKHMEYVLSNICQSRKTYLRIQEDIPAVKPVAHLCHVILAQMVHFVQQMQYYNAFEVMECSWADLLHKIESAQDLDQVINAHEMFLDTLLTRSLLNEESVELQYQLKAIYDLIVEFQRIQDMFWSQAQTLSNLKNEQEELVQIETKKGCWGVKEKEAKNFKGQLDQFLKNVIPNVKARLKILTCSYEGMVQKFLLMLNDHEDENLRFLSFRLDFNEHFKNRNTRLQSSLTYLHRRRSLKYL